MDTIKAQLRHLEEQVLLPEVRGNRELISLFVDDDFREFGSSGRIFDKGQILDALRSESLTQFSIANFRVDVLAADVALVTYEAIRHSGSSQSNRSSLRSSIWVMRDGEWLLLFHQGTPAGMAETKTE